MDGPAWNFAEQLNTYGPEATPWKASLHAARAYCKWVTNSHYENFSVASFLLPRKLIPHFHAIYAYCRWADDLGDESGSPERALLLLDWWKKQLHDCYEGKIGHPVFTALKPTIEQFNIPLEPFLDLTSAFEQDQRIRRYETYDQLIDYCRRSANPVGRLVLYLCQCFTIENANLSDNICTALQLTNFWQDVRRDFDNLDRVYIPTADRLSFGYGEDDLQIKRFTPQFRELMRELVSRTRELFDAGEPLFSRLPGRIRSNIELFSAGGRAILDRIEALDFDVLTTRPTLSKADKARIIIGSFVNRLARCFR